MVKRIQCFLTDSEAFEMEKAKEKMGETSDYSFVKMAILELCKKCNDGELSVSNPHTSPKSNNPSGFTAYLKEAGYECAGCHFPLPRVEGVKSCPLCGHTQYTKRKEG